MRDPIGVDIYTTRHYKYGGRVCGTREDDLGKKLPCLFFGNIKPLSPLIRVLHMILVKKYGLGLLNKVASMNNKYPSSHQASTELIWAVTGEGNSITLIAYWHSGKKVTIDRHTGMTPMM